MEKQSLQWCFLKTIPTLVVTSDNKTTKPKTIDPKGVYSSLNAETKTKREAIAIAIVDFIVF